MWRKTVFTTMDAGRTLGLLQAPHTEVHWLASVRTELLPSPLIATEQKKETEIFEDERAGFQSSTSFMCSRHAERCPSAGSTLKPRRHTERIGYCPHHTWRRFPNDEQIIKATEMGRA
jgi:hypothetical protein